MIIKSNKLISIPNKGEMFGFSGSSHFILNFLKITTIVIIHGVNKVL